MNDAAAATTFEQHRTYLFSIAYRMLGVAADAQDIVQEAFLRWQSTDRTVVDSERAFLSTIVTRLCLDQLKSARARREQYIGPWLPEPVHTNATIDPSTVSLAFLVLLESLSPLERAAYLLHEVFEYAYPELAEMLGRDEAACRQLVHRARNHVVARKPRFAPSRDAHRRLLESFSAAAASGDVATLEQLLAEDVRSYGDGGGKVAAARKPVEGRELVARLLVKLFSLAQRDARRPHMQIEDINGLPALVVYGSDGSLLGVIDVETDGERVYAVRSQVNPDKLAAIRLLS